MVGDIWLTRYWFGPLSVLSKVLQDDFVWSAITESLTGKRRTSNTNFININCPMCTSRGESADRKQRCGVKRSDQGIGVYCFNCGFKTRFVLGQTLSKGMKNFLEGIGVSSTEVKRINYRALQLGKMIMGNAEAAQLVPTMFRPNFAAKSLPPEAKSLATWATEGCDDPDFEAAATYVFGRGDAIAMSTEFFWSPSPKDDMNRRIILPFSFGGEVVGYTARLIDPATPSKPRYQSDVPTNYIFNNHLLTSASKFIILVEGPFDALACNGISTLGAKISDEQAHWINSSGKTVIVLPDRDKQGQRMIDLAVHHGWSVSFPKLKDGSGKTSWWDKETKDAADAGQNYGKLYTVRSIIESATSNKMQIAIQQKLLF